MSEIAETIQNPLFASQYIGKFVHLEEIDNVLIQKLNWKIQDNIGICILPIVDRIPTKKNGIFRIFVANFGELEQQVKVSFRIFGYLKEKDKIRKGQSSFKKLIISSNEVWYRDVIFQTDIKLGKNFFQLIATYKENKKKKIIQEIIDYNEIMPVDDFKQIERQDFLDLAFKPYIDPSAITYWVYCSLFGPRKYSKEPKVVYITKWIVFLASIGTIGTFLLFNILPDIALYISSGTAVASLFTFFTDKDRKTVREIYELGLSESKRKASITELPEKINWLKLFTLKSDFFYYVEEESIFAWKSKAENGFKSTIVSVSEALKIQLNIKEGTIEEEERIFEEIITKRKVAIKKVIHEREKEEDHEGIVFEDDISIDFDAEIQTLDSISSYSVPSKAIELEDSFELPVEVIETGSYIKADSVVFDVSDKPFTTDLKPIVTDSDAIESDSSLKIDKARISVSEDE